MLNIFCRNMAAGHRAPNLSHSKTIDKSLEDGQNSGCLDLSNRKFYDFPKAAENYDLADTVEADISKNRLTELPAEICDFVLLEKLNCYHNAIKSLPESILRMHYLNFLDLSRNQFTNLPPFLCQLKSLEVLIVSNNRLVSIPEEIGQLSNLMELDVSDNEIALVPPHIGQLTELKILSLRKNVLVELPREISELKLKSLDFSCNKIQSLPLDFRRMDSLEQMILDNNPLIDPPAHICTKGRVHILKYLQILAVREDRRRGVVSEPAFNRNTLRRSYQKEDMEAVRLRRKAVVSTDSGYITDNTHRWNPSGAVENGLDSALKAAESLKEQRAERHLELKTRLTSAELRSPGSAVTPTSLAAESSPTGGDISPVKMSATGANPGEDLFARELQRQKQEYEKKKRRAEQLKAEGSRRSSRPPISQNTSSPQNSNNSSASRMGGRPPQPPLRSASVHAESGIVHGYNGAYQHSAVSAHHPHYHRSRDKEEHRNSNYEDNSGANNTYTDTPMDRSITDSHRSSPISISSQDGDGRASTTPSVASSGTAEINSINKTVTSETKRKSTADSELRMSRSLRARSSFKDKLARPSSATAAIPEPVAERNRQATKSLPSAAASGFQPVRAVNKRSSNASSGINGGEQVVSRESAPGDDAQLITSIKTIIESRLKVNLPHDVMGELRDGVVLCHLANHVKPRTVSQIHVKSNAVPKLSMAKCKRNVENFLDACRQLGVPQEHICSQADIIDDKRPAPVLCTINALKDLKSSASKNSHNAQQVHSRSSTPRSRPSSGSGPISRTSAGSSRTAVKSRNPQPLQSIV